MATVYKIHPAIGLARVGDHPDAFFVGPEIPGTAGIEIGPDGLEGPVLRYKEGGRIKRQAARFRVFQYLQDEHGALQLLGEVTADEARIEWRVDLVNRKAALERNRDPSQPALPRNTDIADRASLVIRNAQPVSISGRHQGTEEFNGAFLGEPVYLGELRTDGKGRLLVLGGRGRSRSVPPGVDIPDFANNDRWHDDVSDGPVTAVVTLPGQEPFAVQHPSWVTVAPPDFAPLITAIVTLYDIAFQAAIEKGALTPAARPSFRQHIMPLIERAGDLRWVNQFDKWSDLASSDWAALADTGPTAARLRSQVAERLQNPGLANFALPAFIDTYVRQWAGGDFVSDLDGVDPPLSVPDQLDRAALDGCVGNNFFPGIEASSNLRDRDLYAHAFRLDQANTEKVYPGCLTEIMAVPWQADFRDCTGGIWWPSQRPDIAMTSANDIPASQAAWEAPIAEEDHVGMIEHVFQLGFVVPDRVAGQVVFVEADRDPAFPRAPPLVASADPGGSGPA